jgi:phytoene desaturase
MFDVVRAMESLAKELGVKFQTNANIEKIIVENKTAVAIQVMVNIDSDLVLSGADYTTTIGADTERILQRILG